MSLSKIYSVHCDSCNQLIAEKLSAFDAYQAANKHGWRSIYLDGGIYRIKKDLYSKCISDGSVKNTSKYG